MFTVTITETDDHGSTVTTLTGLKQRLLPPVNVSLSEGAGEGITVERSLETTSDAASAIVREHVRKRLVLERDIDAPPPRVEE